MKNCVKREELFDYFNHSLALNRMQEIKKHMDGCKACQQNLQVIREEISLIRKSLEDLNPEVKPVHPFTASQKITNKKLSYRKILSLAAGISLLLAFSTLLIKNDTHNQQPVNDYEYFKYIPDLNDAWKQNSVSVTIYDKNGRPVNHQIIGD